MAKAYRDPLESAHARVRQLEEEVSRLREIVGTLPATPAEIEASRLENELVKLDLEWEAICQRGGWASDNSTRRLSERVQLGAALVCAIAMPIMLGREHVSWTAHAFVVAIAAALASHTLYQRHRARRARRSYEAHRSQIVAQLSSLGGRAAVAPDRDVPAP